MTSPAAHRRPMPSELSFEQVSNQAVVLLREYEADDSDAKRRANRNRRPSDTFQLADAQRVLAEEYGFSSWADLKRYVEQAELIHATSTSNVEGVKRLVAAGRNINGRDQWGNTPLGWVKNDGPERLEIMRFLLAHGADPNAPAYNDHTPLALRAYYGDAQGVDLLLANGADPNRAREFSGETPLHLVMTKAHPGRLACVKLLLEAGADPGAPCKSGVSSDRETGVMVRGETPLHLAAQTGDAELVEEMLRGGADANAEDRFGARPADWATKAGHEEIANRLNEASA